MRSIAAVLLFALSASPALAQRAPVIVIPGKPGVPVLMNGVDVSWSVIEGEFGLDHPGRVTPTVIYRPVAVALPYAARYDMPDLDPGYFPRDGRRPGYGRLEINPPANRKLPPPAPSYYRSWSSQSQSGPVTEYQNYDSPPIDVTPNVWAGQNRRHHGSRNRAGSSHHGRK